MSLKVLGICGGGGIILHAMKAHLVGNIEPRAIFRTPHDQQWKLNFKVGYDNKDVQYPRAQVNAIVGAPDCGHSSMFALSRAKAFSDPTDNASFKFFVDSIRYYKPRMFGMENLPKLVDTMGDSLYDQFDDYNLKLLVRPVSAWGNSQITRIRLVIVGVRKDLPKDLLKKVKLPDEDSFQLKTSAQLIKGLVSTEDEELGHVREPDDFMVCMHYEGERKISVGHAREIWMSEYEHLKKWPANVGNMINQPGVYRNFEDDYPLTVRKQNRQFNHAGYMLSPREIARIQGVPDSFKIWYDDKFRMYCINKARALMAKTPPYELGVWFNKVFNDINLAM